MLRSIIRAIDRFFARMGGIYEFSQDPQNILRLQVARARHSVSLPDIQVKRSTPVLILHFWNSHLPPVPTTGAGLTWAIQFRRLLIRSLQAAAKEWATDPRLAELPAIGGVFSLLPDSEKSGSAHLMRRLGFTILPEKESWVHFGEFIENAYSWLLIYAYNPGSLTSRKLFHLYRFEIWMSKEEFLHRYLIDHHEEISE